MDAVRTAPVKVARAYERWRGIGDHPWAARRSGRFYLGFDDGPDPEWTPRILDELGRLEVRATFFAIGERAQAAPALVERMLAEGHELELHCMRHVSHMAGREAIEADTDEALAVLAELGVRPTRWRLPYLAGDWWAPEVARSRGLRLTGGSADPRDWTGAEVAEMLERMEPDLRAGRIAVLHDGIGVGAPRTSSANTVALLEPLVGRLRKAGLEPSPISAGPGFSRVFLPPRGVDDVGPDLAIEVIEERSLTASDRAALCRLLGDAIPRDNELYRSRGWRRVEPEYRVVARAGRQIVGQVSAFRLENRQGLYVLGFGDFVVRPDHRRRGIGLSVGRRAVREGERRKADILLGDTSAFARLVEGIAWRKVERFELWYERDGACHWHPLWWMRWDGSPPTGGIQLDDGDF